MASLDGTLAKVAQADAPKAAPLLIVTHVPLRKGPRGLQIDDQTAAEIRQWLRHFERITYMGIAEDHAAGSSSTRWVDIDGDPDFARCRIIALPYAYRPLTMLRTMGPVHRQLREAIPQHTHLMFTIGGILGDWPALASLEASRQGRAFANKVDRVEAEVLGEKAARHPSVLRRLAGAVYLPMMEQFTRFVLRRSRVSLLQGLDVYNHYKPFCREPYVTYNTHTHVADRISGADLAQKRAAIASGRPLRIVYVGRAAPMKGPTDWLDVLDRLDSQGVPFTATWVGDGPDLPMMSERVAGSSLSGKVHFPGFQNDREALLKTLRDSDMLMFCHKTLESPRCLIESLVSGCPLVGYGTDYSRGLVAAHGGGAFVQMNDIAGLSETIIALHADRSELSSLVGAAATSGLDYNEDAIYGYRAGLMQKA